MLVEALFPSFTLSALLICAPVGRRFNCWRTLRLRHALKRSSSPFNMLRFVSLSLSQHVLCGSFLLSREPGDSCKDVGCASYINPEDVVQSERDLFFVAMLWLQHEKLNLLIVLPLVFIKGPCRCLDGR